MDQLKNNELIKRPEVVDEINRHKWFESERAGHDIGFEKAAQDWLEKFSKVWMDYHLPNQKKEKKSKINPQTSKKRRAKSYV